MPSRSDIPRGSFCVQVRPASFSEQIKRGPTSARSGDLVGCRRAFAGANRAGPLLFVGQALELCRRLAAPPDRAVRARCIRHNSYWLRAALRVCTFPCTPRGASLFARIPSPGGFGNSGTQPAAYSSARELCCSSADSASWPNIVSSNRTSAPQQGLGNQHDGRVFAALVSDPHIRPVFASQDRTCCLSSGTVNPHDSVRASALISAGAS